MAVTAQRTESIVFSNAIAASLSFAAASNTNSPGSVDVMTLSSGANTITLPTGGTTPTGVVILPPALNVNTITVKGSTGDTGIALSKLDPTVITFDSPPPATFVLTAGAQIVGLRLVWV